jgi:hypothetical protein
MARSSFVQTSFLGGFWSQFSQGRMDDPDYKRGLAECLNGIPLEEGCWVRRSGTQAGGHTRNGNPARIFKYNFTAASPYDVEFTDGHIRLWAGTDLVADDYDTVSQISLANPAVLTTATSQAWATGDQIYITPNDNYTSVTAPYIFNRQLQVTRLTSTTFSLTDPVSGLGIDGSKVLWPLAVVSATVWHILDIGSTGYSVDELPALRCVQSDLQLTILQSNSSPAALAAVTGLPFATFTLTTPTLIDGPFLDPPTDGSTLTPSGATGSITLTASSIASINGGLGFQTTDVGRLVRLLSRPALWAAGTTYPANGPVYWNGNTYYSIAGSNVGNPPDQNPTKWTLSATLQNWTYLLITAWTSTTVVTATIKGNGTIGTTTIPYTTAATIWQLGVYSNTTGYPTCGCYHEGRLWLAGAAPNRIDATVPNDFNASRMNFSPTDVFGTVGDANAISYTFNSAESNQILWMQPSAQGIIVGTEGGEWLIQASSNNDVLTPTNIQAHLITVYGCANIEPKRTGLSSVFVQKHKRKLLEYIADAFSGRFYGPNLAEKAKALTSQGIEELAYQEELAPIVWARLGDGTLAGTTYRRESLFSSQPPKFNAWHRHALGSQRTVEYIAAGPSAITAGTIDTLAMVTNDTTNTRYFELMRPIHDEDDPLSTAWYVDGGVIPISGATINGGTGLRFYGLHPLAGQICSIVVGGLDCGDVTVNADGYADVTYGVSNAALTYAYLATLGASGTDFGDMAVAVDDGAIIIPACVGFNFISRGQGLRPVSPQDTGAQAGPGFGKLKRGSSFAVMLQNAIQVYFGTTFDRMRLASFRTKSWGKAFGPNEPFTGIFWNPIEDQYGFDNQLCWEIRRPYPCSVQAFGLFDQTEDR